MKYPSQELKGPESRTTGTMNRDNYDILFIISLLITQTMECSLCGLINTIPHMESPKVLVT